MNSHFSKEKHLRRSQEGSKFREEVFSKIVRAGRRTYFFDVKATRGNEYYLTITESKKQSEYHEPAHYEKHKIFLYKEDFKRFFEGLSEILDYIDENQPQTPVDHEVENSYSYSGFNDVDFDDLDK
jgi:hypothetical protein